MSWLIATIIAVYVTGAIILAGIFWTPDLSRRERLWTPICILAWPLLVLLVVVILAIETVHDALRALWRRIAR